MKPVCLAVCASLALTALGDARLHAQTSYKFINIVDSSGPFSAFLYPEINLGGTVAFRADYDAGGAGIHTGTGGALTTIAELNGQFSQLTNPSINDAGEVAFNASLVVGGSGVFSGSGGAISTIADTTGDFTGFSGASINNLGAVAFHASGTPTVRGVYLGGSGPPTKIVATSTATLSVIGSSLQLNNSGVVAFFATNGFSPSGIYTSDGAVIKTIVTGNGLGLLPRISETGTVAFWRNEIGSGNGGPTTLIAGSAGPYQSFASGADINSDGTVVFNAELDDGTKGIYSGPDPVAHRVIELGDALFGSTYSQFGSYPRINDDGDVVFGYELANGIVGIAVAMVVPEPSAIALAACSVGLIAMRRRP